MKVEIMSFNNSFIEYLCSFIWFDTDKLMTMMKNYPIGATEKGEPIFWHINAEHKITNGRIVTMDADTGKYYDESWYYQDNRPVCLFGEHLLQDNPEKTVALVKDEATAVIMSCFPTPYLWLATGTKDITPIDLFPLEGRSMVVFPDKGEYDTWSNYLQQIPNLQFHVSDVKEKSQSGCHNIAQMVLIQQPLRPTEAEAALMRMEDANPCLALLVKALDLEVVGISPTSDEANLKTPKSESISEEPKGGDVVKMPPFQQEKPWHGRNPECHNCPHSHEGINGTYCGKLHRYVEYGKGDCGVEADIPPALG